MDDYPRAPPHIGELHVDLLSWMGFFSGTMKEIAEFIGEEDDMKYYANVEKAIIDNIDGLSHYPLPVYDLTVVVIRSTLERRLTNVLRRRCGQRRYDSFPPFPGQLCDRLTT
jgi:hypothetical protein